VTIARPFKHSHINADTGTSHLIPGTGLKFIVGLTNEMWIERSNDQPHRLNNADTILVNYAKLLVINL
jgi:hypothetical protein